MENSLLVQLIDWQAKGRKLSHNSMVNGFGNWTLARITNFLWLCLHGSIPVKEVLAVKGINYDKVCPLCRDQEESIVHLLHECIFARDLWRKLEVPPSHVNSFTNSFEVCLKNNCLK